MLTREAILSEDFMGRKEGDEATCMNGLSDEDDPKRVKKNGIGSLRGVTRELGRYSCIKHG